MNTLGHHYIADEVATFRRPEPSQEFAIGAMLPHLAQAAGTELDYASLEGELLEGVQLHHATHPAFYDTEEYKHLWDVVGHSFANFGRLDLVQVGIEAQLDGWIIEENSPTIDSFRRSLSLLKEDYPRIGQFGQNVLALTTFLEDFAHKGVPAYLQSPKAVANLLIHQHGMRASRQLPAMLEATQSEVRAMAVTLLGSVISRMPF